MKQLRNLVASALVGITAFSAGAQVYQPSKQETDSLSMAAASIMAEGITRSLQGLSSLGVTVDIPVFQQALIDAISGKTVAFNAEAADNYISRIVDKINESYAVAEQQFIDSICAASNGIRLDGGTVLVVVQEGEGVFPTAADKVRVTYTGRLSDGSVFDQTDNGPVEFSVANLVPGFTKGLEHMKAGGTYRLIIPPSQAYGERGVQGHIPPNSALDFTVNLISILPPEAK